MPSEKRARQRALRDQKYAVEERKRRRGRRLRRSGSVTIVAAVVVALIFLLSQHSTPKKAATGSSTTTTVATTGSTSATTTTSTPATTTTVAPVAIAPTCPPAGGSAERVVAFTKAPPICISKTGTYDATVKTDAGSFVFQMQAAKSLLAVNNFVFLARYQFYNSIIFHRVIPGFMAQGGDPTGTGNGGPGYSFTGNTPAAGCTTCYALGAVAMANSGSPSSDGSQFFIVDGKTGETLQPNYTTFGQVISGMSVVNKIVADGSAAGVPPTITHRIISVTIKQVS